MLLQQVTLLTTGVAYAPAVANWLKPYPPSSGWFLRNTTFVTWRFVMNGQVDSYMYIHWVLCRNQTLAPYGASSSHELSSYHQGAHLKDKDGQQVRSPNNMHECHGRFPPRYTKLRHHPSCDSDECLYSITEPGGRRLGYCWSNCPVINSV